MIKVRHLIPLAALPLAELQTLAPQIEADVFSCLTLEGSLAARDHPGGTSPVQVHRQVAQWRQRLGGG